ncbi:RANB9-like protein [Mya arenaria]|uniref:RANB9-like protein n=1 Tax=Mya arenaria TaxID=6604 RepID=A0ABY7EUG1_MYAAR|nr:RANB9-like protein [Mya arenaria]
MAASNESGTSDSNSSTNTNPDEHLKKLYPAVNEEETPLPRSWSAKDKFNYLGLTQNNLRVHYKGVGKTHKDAASVRASHPIPSACGIYYFEVKIISKGRDGYMGIGLAAQGVNQNRLPGWDKQSYGYHGDDGNSFCSSGQGEPYGPTFSTGDVIGCCVNLVENTCFYTKNGHGLYPAVGLQTPGEVVEANFGQVPFAFDIEDYMREWKMKTRLTIERFPVNDKRGEWHNALQSIVSTYLVHHGYCATAEAFAKSTGQNIREDLASIKNRQRISKLVLAGRMGEAIETTQQLYPMLLERDSNLLFMLKCRQFIEMVNGCDSEVRGAALRSPRSQNGGSARSSPSRSPIHHTHVPRVSPLAAHQPHSGSTSPSRSKTLKLQHTSFQSHPHSSNSSTSQNSSSTSSSASSSSSSLSNSGVTNSNKTNNQSDSKALNSNSEENLNAMNVSNSSANGVVLNGSESRLIEDVEMLDGIVPESDGIVTNGQATNGQCMNGNNGMECKDEDMDVDPPLSRRQLCGGSQLAIEKMLQFGRELQSMSVRLKKEHGKNDANKKQLQDAFSLLAYSDPWSSPVGGQLDPVQREPVCANLNSAILESQSLPNKPPLELVIAQTRQCMRLMSSSGIASSAFASTDSYLH